MPFQVYQDAGETSTWGSASFLTFGSTPTITAVVDTSGKVNVTRTLYGQVTAPQNQLPGAYSSTFANEGFFWGLNLLSCAGVTVGTFVTPAAFTFTAIVPPNCLVTTTDATFPSVGLLTSPLAANNRLNVRCTANTAYTVSLGNGLYGSSPTTRQMANGASRASYGIYQDSAFSKVWGDVSQGLGYVQSGVGTGVAASSFTAYEQVPVQPTPAPGLYKDTVVATVTY